MRNQNWWKKKGRWVWIDLDGEYGCFDLVDAIVREVIPGMGSAGTTFFQQLPSFHVEVLEGYHKGHWLVQIVHNPGRVTWFLDSVRIWGFKAAVWDWICSLSPDTACSTCKARWFCKERTRTDD